MKLGVGAKTLLVFSISQTVNFPHVDTDSVDIPHVAWR